MNALQQLQMLERTALTSVSGNQAISMLSSKPLSARVEKCFIYVMKSYTQSQCVVVNIMYIYIRDYKHLLIIFTIAEMTIEIPYIRFLVVYSTSLTKSKN